MNLTLVRLGYIYIYASVILLSFYGIGGIFKISYYTLSGNFKQDDSETIMQTIARRTVVESCRDVSRIHCTSGYKLDILSILALCNYMNCWMLAI